jgi:hypothetical protein
MYCLCVNVYCHRVTTQLQIINISYHKGGKVVSRKHRLHLPGRRYSLYSFLLDAESNPVTQCSRKDEVNETYPTERERDVIFLQEELVCAAFESLCVPDR